MGVIRRQGIKHSIVSYVGVLIGTISTLWIYPLSLDTLEAYGLAQVLIDMATLLVPFASFGILSLVVRYFPHFQNRDNAHNGFLALLFLALLLSFVIFLLLYLCLKDSMANGLRALKFNVDLLIEYQEIIGSICFVLVLSGLFDAFARNFHRITVQSIFTNLVPKITLPLLILLVYSGKIELGQFVNGILLMHLVVLAGLVLYVKILKQLKFRLNLKFLNAALLKEMGVYALFGILGSFGNFVAIRIDSLMVATLIDPRTNGIYKIASFISNVIEVPSKAVNTISGPIIAQAWQNQDMEEIQAVYKKSSITLGTGGLFIFILIWASVDDIFLLTPRADLLSSGKYVILFLGIGKILDMLTGVNSLVIGLSAYFRFNLIAVLLLALLNIMLNYTLIEKLHLGINGAALATMCSLALYNIAKLLFIWIKFKLHPFSMATLKVFVIALFAYLPTLILPATPFVLLNIAIKSSLAAGIFVPLVYFWNISSDISGLIETVLNKIRKFIS